MYSCTFSVLEFPTRMSFRRVINYHRIIEFSWLSEPPLPRAPHFRRRMGKFQAGLVAIKRKNGIDRLRFALVRPRPDRVINYEYSYRGGKDKKWTFLWRTHCSSTTGL